MGGMGVRARGPVDPVGHGALQVHCVLTRLRQL